jgi:hypothetical protein
MIEAYAFLAMFALQILTGSVIFPERVIKRVRGWGRDFGSERIAQLYPEFDYGKWAARFATGFRAANIVILLLGLGLLGWFHTLLGQPAWTRAVKIPVVVYIFVQFSPMLLFALYAVVRYFKLLAQPSQEAKRSAILQRRGLFDFASPFAVWFAVLTYVGFVAFAIYMDLEIYGNASLSSACYTAIGALTAMYALNAFVIYKYLYGRRNPLVSHEGRVHTIRVNVKSAVYGSIATGWFFLLLGVVGQPHLEEWQPFALTLFFVVIQLLSVMGLSTPARKPRAELGSEVQS